MYRLFFITALILSSLSAQNLNQQAVQGIARDGEALFNLETIARNSADKLYASNAMEGMKGYLAYKKDGLFHCIYWKEEANQRKVVYHYSALNPEKPKFYTLDKLERPLSEYEILLANIKRTAQDTVRSGTDYFLTNRGVSLNLHLLEKGNNIYVFVLANQRSENTIPIGNDYRLKFDKNGKLLTKAKFRSTFTEVPTDVKPDATGQVVTFHSNVKQGSQLISPTDICNLLLYSPDPSRHVHHMTSKRFICMYEVKTRLLIVQKRQ
jgi:hypothetical protein